MGGAEATAGGASRQTWPWARNWPLAGISSPASGGKQAVLGQIRLTTPQALTWPDGPTLAAPSDRLRLDPPGPGCPGRRHGWRGDVAGALRTHGYDGRRGRHPLHGQLQRRSGRPGQGARREGAPIVVRLPGRPWLAVCTGRPIRLAERRCHRFGRRGGSGDGPAPGGIGPVPVAGRVPPGKRRHVRGGRGGFRCVWHRCSRGGRQPGEGFAVVPAHAVPGQEYGTGGRCRKRAAARAPA